MHRHQIICGLIVSLGLHGLLIIIFRLTLPQLTVLAVPGSSSVDYGEISLCEASPLSKEDQTIDLKNLLPDLPKEVASSSFIPLSMPTFSADSSSSSNEQSSGSNDTQSSSSNETASSRATNSASDLGPAAKKGVPLHGKVKAGKTIIYILDSSSSMSEADALSHAKRCLRASLLNLDETTKFQIIAYNSRAFSHTQEPILCTERNRQDALVWLEKLTPQGSSHHQSGFESACWRRPDAIFHLTDADDLGPKELAILSKIIPEDTYLNVTIFGESEPRGLLEKLTEPRGGTVRRYSQK